MKKSFMALAAFVFLMVKFIDQNTVHVPINILMAGPYHIYLSVIIAVSMLIGSVLTVITYLLYRYMQSKRQKSLYEEEITA